jgi:hypothetical protein
MSPFSCTREREVNEMLHRGHWPEACASELRDHVEGCRACSDLVLVTQTFQAARAHTAAMARPESAGALWWRAQLRRRNAAIARVGKPILGAQIFAFAVAMMAGAGVLAWQARQGFHLWAWLEELPQALHLDALLPAAVPHIDGGAWLLVPILATVALVGGVVVYLATEKQ